MRFFLHTSIDHCCAAQRALQKFKDRIGVGASCRTLCRSLAIFFILSSPTFAAIFEEDVPSEGWVTNRNFGPFQDIETACRTEVYSPGYPDGNYAGYQFRPEWLDVACFCHSNPAPNIGGFLHAVCPAVTGTIISSTRILVGQSVMCRLRHNQQFYVSSTPPAATQCGESCNSVGDPINPTTGSTHHISTEIGGAGGGLDKFKKFYNSADTDGNDAGWRHTFSRQVIPRFSVVESKQYLQSAQNSPLYDTPEMACGSGFSNIKSDVPQWSGVVTAYSDGKCNLFEGGQLIGSLAIYSNVGTLTASSAPLAYDVIRDDGQTIRLVNSGGSILAPSGIALRLEQTANGYKLTDANDNVELYDLSGKLLSVTSRAGVAQTMSYDSSGRLSGVTDSFGHSLSLSYDANGRVMSASKP